MDTFVCGVIETSCPNTFAFNDFETTDDCLEALQELPQVEGVNSIDGKSKMWEWEVL